MVMRSKLQKPVRATLQKGCTCQVGCGSNKACAIHGAATYPNGCPILSDWERPIHSLPHRPQVDDL